MKLNVFNRKKTALEKLTSTYDVKLDASASQLIMDVLAKLYDNPVEAAIREYVSNAHDANVEAGSTEPVHLHVPTEDEPYLEVSDTGNGLDYLGIVSVFANFGTSTKRDSNEFIGGFGIGSKSGLAISDKIHVSSVCNGLLNEFVIERKDGILQTRFITENKKTTDHSGTTVAVNVKYDFLCNMENLELNKYHYVIQGWSASELIVTNPEPLQYSAVNLNNDRVPDVFHKIPNTNTWISRIQINTTETYYARQHVRIGRVLYKIPDNIVRKLPDNIYEKIQFTTMVHDVPIGELRINYAREKLDVSEQETVNKLLNIMTQAYNGYISEYNAITTRTDIDVPTKLRLLREHQYPYEDDECLDNCGLNRKQPLPFKYTKYLIERNKCILLPDANSLNDRPDVFILDDKGLSSDTYINICIFLDDNYYQMDMLFPHINKIKHSFGKRIVTFCDSAALYWHINSDTSSVIKIEDMLRYMPGENSNAEQNYNDALVQHSKVYNMNTQPWITLELVDIPDNPQTHIINSNTSNCLDDVYDFVLPKNNNNVIIATTYTDGIDWILRNKPNITYFSKSNMDAYAQEIRTIIQPVLVNDNAVYLLRTIIKNKQLSSNISMLNLDTKQDTEAYLAALHKATRRVEPKTHNLSFDQKVFLAALVSRDRKFLSKKDAKKIIKRLKLLFPDELKLIKDTADEIAHKVQL